MTDSAINLREKLKLVDKHWTPHIVAELNDYQFKIVKVKGDFVWHSHADTDEAFLVIEGELRIDFRDRAVTVGPGELYVVPKGEEHKPFAESEVKMLLIEPCGVPNTGDAETDRTAQDVWV